MICTGAFWRHIRLLVKFDKHPRTQDHSSCCCDDALETTTFHLLATMDTQIAAALADPEFLQYVMRQYSQLNAAPNLTCDNRQVSESASDCEEEHLDANYGDNSQQSSATDDHGHGQSINDDIAIGAAAPVHDTRHTTENGCKLSCGQGVLAY